MVGRLDCSASVFPPPNDDVVSIVSSSLASNHDAIRRSDDALAVGRKAATSARSAEPVRMTICPRRLRSNGQQQQQQQRVEGATRLSTCVDTCLLVSRRQQSIGWDLSVTKERKRETEMDTSWRLRSLRRTGCWSMTVRGTCLVSNVVGRWMFVPHICHAAVLHVRSYKSS